MDTRTPRGTQLTLRSLHMAVELGARPPANQSDGRPYQLPAVNRAIIRAQHRNVFSNCSALAQAHPMIRHLWRMR